MTAGQKETCLKGSNNNTCLRYRGLVRRPLHSGVLRRRAPACNECRRGVDDVAVINGDHERRRHKLSPLGETIRLGHRARLLVAL
jgi:hypothetical protein